MDSKTMQGDQIIVRVGTNCAFPETMEIIGENCKLSSDGRYYKSNDASYEAVTWPDISFNSVRQIRTNSMIGSHWIQAAKATIPGICLLTISYLTVYTLGFVGGRAYQRRQ